MKEEIQKNDQKVEERGCPIQVCPQKKISLGKGEDKIEWRKNKELKTRVSGEKLQ